ncbi:MAG: transcriptional coactivator p15/PC4 family protein [Candidatus Omnitrophota bacterium]|nr:transcriptional coactivator p15/PC4 family protein [Candidatus Omnitrophota bacterium]
MDKTVKTFAKNKFQEIRVGIKEFKGINLIDIRIWTRMQGVEDMVPTSKGVSLNVSLYPELKEAVLSLEKELKDNHLL